MEELKGLVRELLGDRVSVGDSQHLLDLLGACRVQVYNIAFSKLAQVMQGERRRPNRKMAQRRHMVKRRHMRKMKARQRTCQKNAQ